MADSLQTMIRSYQRKEEFWISGREVTGYAEVYLSGIGENEIHVKGDQLTFQTGEVRQISNGDTITINNYEITFFENWIEIAGVVTEDQIQLLEIAGKEERYPEYPHYKRSPRVIYHVDPEKIEIKAPPQKKAMTTGGIVQLIVPTLSTLAFTVLMGVMLKRGPYIYMSIGMTIITLIFSIKNFVSQSKEIKASNKKRDQVYKEYLLKTRKKIRKKRQEEATAMAYLYPKAQALSQMVELSSSRLYERTPLEEDFLQVTLGYYSGESDIQVSYEKDELEMEEDELRDLAKEVKREYAKVSDRPLTVDLKTSHLGLVGDKKNIHAQLKYMLMQLTFFHSYHDLQVIFIHNEAYRPDFSYLRWYPHLQIQAINVTGEICTEQARDQIFGSVQQILKDRKLKQEEEQQELQFSPHILFVIDEPSLILNHTIMEYLQSKELNLGFSFIYTTNQRENLPENVKTVCLIENSKDGRLLLKAGKRVDRTFELQSIDQVDLEKDARHLSAIIHDQGMRSQIPESITFFDMYQVEHPEQLEVRRRWSENQSHKTLAVPLGVRAKEDYVELNLHEKAHGPHGLVAGTTGSGKSEIVQSYILSLAVNFHPYEVGFLLIDYKGGGMANLFSDLPHLLGTITNLDKAESMRAMASIKSELARRQQIFSDNGVNHINGYNKLFKLGKVAEPLPHLFLISDEFAELKKEQPEFMSELVSAARIGRSLGIHLILATQKPSGVVDDQIWTNSKFKLCLKVQNAGDSKEMLKTPDAANITQAGRAYLQVGNNEIYELFQSAWSGATYKKEQTAEEKEDDRVYLINEIGQGELINRDLSGPKESNQIKDTQLDVIVRHVKEEYEKETAVEVKRPWLPPLGDNMLSPYTQTVQDSSTFTELDLQLGLGMIDLPEEQDQREYTLDFVGKGHLLYMASSGYGKSTILGNIILGLAMKNAVRNLNMYILDLGNSALIPYKGVPHVADYMGIDDGEKIDKFQKLILDIISERKKLLAKAMTQNFNVYNQSQPEPLKAIVIAIDNYDVVGELGDSLISFIQKVARDGAGLGVYLVVTMTRENVMRGATKGSFKERIAGFNFTDGENNSFIGRSQHQLSEEKRGRVLVKTDGINVMQLYTPVSCENELVYNSEIKELIAKVAQMSTEEAATGIPVLPEVLRYEMLPEYPGYVQEEGVIPLGIDTESLEVQALDLNEEIGLVLGSRGSGKTNVVKTLLRKITQDRIYIIDNNEGMLASYGQESHIKYANTSEGIDGLLEDIANIVSERKETYEEERIDNLTLSVKEFGKQQSPIYVVVDHLQLIMEMVGKKESLDILLEAAKYGFRILITADHKVRKTMGSELCGFLTTIATGAVLGNIREQNVFSITGIREENRKVDIGYSHVRGVTKKMKLIENN